MELNDDTFSVARPSATPKPGIDDQSAVRAILGIAGAMSAATLLGMGVVFLALYRFWRKYRSLFS